MNLQVLRQLEQHLFEAHPQRVLDLLHHRSAFVDVRECCPVCQALVANVQGPASIG